MKLVSGVIYSVAALTLWGFAASSVAQSRIDQGIAYGTYYGATLTLDVYHPADPNGLGVLLVHGTGWHGEPGYGSGEMKEGRPQANRIRDVLVEDGFTVFVPNYRVAPGFRYPAAIEDLRRAVRYIRANASEFGIAVAPLGALGTSAGGHLVGLLALQDGQGEPGAADPIMRHSAKVQAAVTIASGGDPLAGPPMDFFASFIGEPRGFFEPSALWVESSPVTYISDDDPPFLVIHARDDRVADIVRDEAIVDALRQAGRDVEFIEYETGGHEPVRDAATITRISGWLLERLAQ
jgi:acetyl esterase/lipase